MDNKSISELVLAKIRDAGYKPYRINRENGYFVFDLGEDAVTHFRIRGLLGWRFGIWTNADPEDEMPYLQFFCQHDDNVDKFKPSASCFMVEEEDDIHDSFAFCRIVDILDQLRLHPFLSYFQDATHQDEASVRLIPYYLSGKFFTWKQKVRRWKQDWFPFVWIWIKLLFARLDPILSSVEIRDGNSDGWISSPRWSICLYFRSNDTEEAINRNMDYLWFWFKRQYDHAHKFTHKDSGRTGYQISV